MKIRRGLGIMTVIALVSCSINPDEKKDEHAKFNEEKESVEITTPHHLELKKGNKWIVDEGIAEGIDEINQVIKAHKGEKVLDYQLLGDAIAVQIKHIISSCTMKGKAHGELHKWLLPFLDLKEALVMTASPEEGAAVLENIKSELTVYAIYFK